MDILFTLILVLISSMSITWLIRCHALQQKILDIPNERSSHSTPTPRGGGLGIVVVFSIVVLAMTEYHYLPTQLAWALEGGIVIAAIGYVDDRFKISAKWRMLIHIAAAIWAIYFLKGMHILDLGTWQFTFEYVGNLLAIMGIIWLINLYNFMDGIDGLAGSQGIFAALTAAGILWALNQNTLAFLLILFASCIFGFTILNWPPAKVFLGDVGSGYLGYIFAVIGVYTANEYLLPSYFWIMVFAIFICDATYTLFYRIFKRKKWYAAHREHAYQELTTFGISHQKVTLSIIVCNLLFILPMIYFALTWPQYAFSLLMLLVSALFVIWMLIKQRRIAH